MLTTTNNFEFGVRQLVANRAAELREQEREDTSLRIRNHIAKMLNGDRSA